MIVDTRTLADLGVLPVSETDWALRGLLDNTHSRAGLNALTGLLKSPISDGAEISRRQIALRAMFEFGRHCDWRELDSLSMNILGYLDSNFVHCPRTALSGFFFVMRHRDIANFIEARVRLVRTFVVRCWQIANALEHVDGDRSFVEMRTVLRHVADQPAMRRICELPINSPLDRLRLCAMDQAIRVDHKDDLRAAVNALATLDALASLAHAANTLGWNFARVEDAAGAEFAIKDLRHPLLLKGVSNDVTLSQDEHVMFITGPNMAGKSTTMRALGLAVYFAHVGLPVAATAARIPRTDVLISSMNERDSIKLRTSLYLAEVRRVKSVVEAVRGGGVVVALLDEVFRGTNVKDAIDATDLLVNGLARTGRGLVVLASHLVEVADKNIGNPGVGMFCMKVDDGGTGPTFSYQLQRGISRIRLGVALLESEGVIEMLNAIGQTIYEEDLSERP